MPFFQFTITLRNKTVLQFIRQMPNTDLDQVWRIYSKISKQHYKSQLDEFKVIQLSKLSPEVKQWIADQGKNVTKNEMDELLNIPDQKGTVSRRKGGSSMGPTLEERL